MKSLIRSGLIVNIVLMVLSVRAFGGTEVKSLPTNVYQVFCAKGSHADEIVVVFAQYSGKYSGFIAKRYDRNGSATLADYVVPNEAEQFHWVLGIDSNARSILMYRTDLLGRPLGFLVYNIAEKKVVSEYADTNAYIGVTRSMKVVAVDSAESDDSCTISVLDVVASTRSNIARVSKGKLRDKDASVIVAGNTLFVKDGFSYTIYDLESRVKLGSGLMSTAFASSVRADQVVVDDASNVIAGLYDGASKTLDVFDGRQNKFVKLKLPFELEPDNVRLVFLNVAQGLYIFRNTATSVESLYRIDTSAPKLQWSNFTEGALYSHALGVEQMCVGTKEAVSIVSLSDYSMTDVATMLDLMDIRFLAQSEKVFLQEGFYSVLFDMKYDNISNYTIGGVAHANTSGNYCFTCTYNSNSTTVEIDSMGTLSSREIRLAMQHTSGCDLFDFTRDRSYAISATKDTIYMYSIPDARLQARFVNDYAEYQLKSAYALTDRPLFLLVGSNGSVRVELVNGSWKVTRVPQLAQTTGFYSHQFKGRYYRDQDGNGHFLYRPDKAKIGDYDIDNGTIQSFTLAPDDIDIVVSDTLGNVIGVTSEPKAYWYDARAAVDMGSMSFGPGEKVRAVDYLYAAGVMAYRTVNQIKFVQSSVTSVENGNERGSIQRDASDLVEVQHRENVLTITAGSGMLESLRVLTVLGQELVHRTGIGDHMVHVDLSGSMEGLYVLTTIVGVDNGRSYHRCFVVNGCVYRIDP